MNVHSNYKVHVSKNSATAKCCKKHPANKAKGNLLPKKSCEAYNNMRNKVLSGHLKQPELNTLILTYPTT